MSEEERTENFVTLNQLYEEARELLAREREHAAVLEQAILTIDANAVALGTTAEGFVAIGYFVPIGPIHKALGSIGHGAPKEPEVMPPDWFLHLLRRACDRTEATETLEHSDPLQ